jgi:hypothetical protein
MNPHKLKTRPGYDRARVARGLLGFLFLGHQFT